MRTKLALILGIVTFVFLALLNVNAAASAQDMVEVRWTLPTVAMIFNMGLAIATFFALAIGWTWGISRNTIAMFFN